MGGEGGIEDWQQQQERPHEGYFVEPDFIVIDGCHDRLTVIRLFRWELKHL